MKIPLAIGAAGLTLLNSAFAGNLLKNASFELPVVEAPMDARKGGSPAQPGVDASWTHFQSMDVAGHVKVGLTNEVSRTGKQSIYVDFAGASKNAEAFLLTELIPVQPDQLYRIALWGRLDRQRPFTLDRSRPYLRLEVEFYQADQATQTGDTIYRVQMIPGSAGRLLFVSGKWSEYFSEVKAPEDGVFMKVTFRWVATGEEGEADGRIYFDDAVVDGPPGAPAVPTEPDTKEKPDAPALPAAPSPPKPQD